MSAYDHAARCVTIESEVAVQLDVKVSQNQSSAAAACGVETGWIRERWVATGGLIELD